MTGHKENELLRDILLDAAAEEFAPEFSSTEQVETSLKFQKSMQSLLSNPKKWAERRQKPVWKRAAKMVATIALIGILSFGMLMLISPKVYAAVVNWVTEWYDTYVMYRFSGEHTESDLPEYQLSYIPEGYHHDAEILSTPNDYSRATSMRFMAYSGDHWLFFQYGPMDSGSAMSIELENMSVSEISINGNPGQLYSSATETQSSCITWIDTESNICFFIDGFLSDDELIYTAQNVSLISEDNFT